MSIGEAFSLLDAYLQDQGNMVQMLKELRDPAVQRLSDMQFFGPSGSTAVRTAVAHIETDWFGWDPQTGVQDAFDPANPAATGWWYGWYGNADKITRETFRRALEVALGVPHDSTDITPTRQWRVMFNWTCGAPLFQGWVVWQCNDADTQNGFVLCSFTTPGNGYQLFATPFHPGTGPEGYGGPAAPGNSGMWVVGDQCTEIVYRDADVGIRMTDYLRDWTNAFLYTHELPDPAQAGIAVVAPTLQDGGVS
jgi:hypothetical protein